MLAAKRAGARPHDGRVVLVTLNQICRFAVRRGWLADNPSASSNLARNPIRVHRQLSRHRQHAPLKTEAGKREVILAPALATTLGQLWLASRFKAPNDFVFVNTVGRGLDYRDVGEGFRQALKRAGLAGGARRLTLHSLRHGYASLLIASGLDVVFVSRQLGHANPNITLEVYAHLFERGDHAQAASDALEASYEAIASIEAGT
jgi:integrase